MSNSLDDYVRGFWRQPIVPSRVTALYGKPLVYMTGAQNVSAHPGCVVEAPFGQDVSGESQFKIAYCTMFDPTRDRKLAGKEWMTNLCTQFSAAKALGFQYVELDQMIHYSAEDVLKAISIAADYRLGVIAKNLFRFTIENAVAVASHSNVWGFIVERGAGTPAQMEALRKDGNKAGIAPVWFVFDSTPGANTCADQARQGGYKGMGVTYSTGHGYKDSISVLTPTP